MSDRNKGELAAGRGELAVAVAAALLGVVFLALELVSRSTLDRLTREDGVVEYLTALFFFVAGVMLLAIAVRRSTSRLWTISLGVGCIFIAGEEISWGQRLLGLRTPENLAESNVQAEINLHNLEGVNGMVRGAGVLLLLAVFVAFPIAVARWPWARRLADRFQIPRPPLTAIPVLLIGLAFMVVPRVLGGDEVFRLDEVGELFVAVVPLLFAASLWHSRDRVRHAVPA